MILDQIADRRLPAKTFSGKNGYAFGISGLRNHSDHTIATRVRKPECRR